MIQPDLQGSFICEDVRQEMNGMHSLVGVLSAVPAPALPIRLLKLCLWTRWCSGAGKFRQVSKIVTPDDHGVVGESVVDFQLREMESHTTNVHYFTGIQFQEFGVHHVEIYLDDELVLRFPLPVLQIKQNG